MSLYLLLAEANQCLCLKTLVYIVFFAGVLKVTTFGLSLIAVLLDVFVLPSTKLDKYGAKKGWWAVVTGASDGIGKEFSQQLAAKGFNVLLVSRTKAKLDALAEEIETKYRVQTSVLAFDASKDEEVDYESLKAAVSSIPVSLLVNNVGQSHSIPVPFVETSDKELRDIITVNNITTLKVTQIVTPFISKTVGQVKNSRGLILTMGSFAALVPTPLLATYAGSKAFLQAWSSALAGELLSQNIDVQLVNSYLVASAMSKVRRSSSSIPSPKAFVSSVLGSVCRRSGAQERYATSTPYWAHAIMHFAIETTVGVYSRIANKVNLSIHKSIRQRALKKAARVSAEKKE